jgi:hypothetical protein
VRGILADNDVVGQVDIRVFRVSPQISPSLAGWLGALLADRLCPPRSSVTASGRRRVKFGKVLLQTFRQLRQDLDGLIQTVRSGQ